MVNTEVNEILHNEVERIRYYIEKEGELPFSGYVYDTIPVSEKYMVINQFRDTSIYEIYASKIIPYRIYDFTIFIGTDRYKISLRHVLLETNKLISWLFITTVLILIILAIGLFLVNQKLSGWAWKPFFRNLSKLKGYDITKKNPVHLETSGISEFDEFNHVITTLMNQVDKDFQKLKEFNEDISHEMQTPLAIIRNKMVFLMESNNLNKKELENVTTAYQEVNKLSKIGKSLTLISRIENEEFTRMEPVDFRDILENILTNMEEIINFKKIEMMAELDSVVVKCDPILANILFTNLIKNAVQHNHKGGYIRMLLNKNKFEIENEGEILKTETTQLFNRFQKANSASENLGLGLAINQKICEIYRFQLNYDHENGQHKFTLFFET
jgi:signal transduction histidine kinase